MANESPNLMGSSRQAVLIGFSAVVGLTLVFAAFRFDWLNWIVDGPGWLVSRFISIDFHEGDVPGFLLALFLSWLWTSGVVYFLGRFTWRLRRSSQT